MSRSGTRRREEARAAAEKIANGQTKSERTVRMVLLVSALAVLLGIIVSIIILVNASRSSILEEYEGPTPAGSDLQGGIALQVGNPAEDAREVRVYADFSCPACAAFEDLNGEDLGEMAQEGSVRLLFHPLNILDPSPERIGYSTFAANAFAEVADQSPEHAQAFMQALFASQPNEGEEVLVGDLVTLAESVGVSREVAAKFEEARFKGWVEEARNQAARDKITSTPTLVVDGEVAGRELVDWTTPGKVRDFLTDLA